MRGLLFGLVLASTACLTACSSKDTPAPAQGSGSSGSSYQALGKKPANARRPMAPPGIEAAALAVGAKVPEVALPAAAGGTWTLADVLGSKYTRVIVMFYRGDW